MLILPIKKKWFDMILAGEKKEEYREIKPYYDIRFGNVWPDSACWNKIHTIGFRNGYSKDSLSFLADVSLSVGTGKTEWGAEPGKKYYVLKIHEVYKEDAECRS